MPLQVKVKEDRYLFRGDEKIVCGLEDFDCSCYDVSDFHKCKPLQKMVFPGCEREEGPVHSSQNPTSGSQLLKEN